MQALILAAGLGNRLRPYTENAAKPSLPFLNIPMLGYSLFLLEQAGLKNLVINTHHAKDSVEACLTKIAKPDYKVSFSFEPEILGSGGGLRKASSQLDIQQPVFLLNGDNICLFTDTQILKKLFDFHVQHDSLATLLCCPHEEVGTTFGGAFIDKTHTEAGYEWGEVKAFSKKLLPNLQGFHFTGVILLSPKIFELLPEGNSNILYDVLVKAIDGGDKVHAFIDRSVQWYETGDPRNYLDATRMCLTTLNQNSSHSRYLEAVLKRFLPGWDNYKREGIFSAQPLPESVIVGAGTLGLIARASKVAPGVRLKDFLVVGEACSLAETSQVEAGVIFPGQKLAQGEKLFSSIKA